MTGTVYELLVFFLPLVLIFYFLILKPQKKQKNEKILIMKNLTVGDKIIIYSGLHGTVTKVPEDSDTFTMEVAPGVAVIVEKEAVYKNISQLDRAAKERAQEEAEKKARKEEKNKQ